MFITVCSYVRLFRYVLCDLSSVSYDVYRTVPNFFTIPYLINRNRNVTVLYLSRHSIPLGTKYQFHIYYGYTYLH